MNLWKWFKEIYRAKKVLYWTKISKGYPEQRIAMHYKRQKWANFKNHVQRVKWQNQTERRAFSNLFNGTTTISPSITKSWSEVTSLLEPNQNLLILIITHDFYKRIHNIMWFKGRATNYIVWYSSSSLGNMFVFCWHVVICEWLFSEPSASGDQQDSST